MRFRYRYLFQRLSDTRLMRLLIGMVTGAHHRPAGRIAESHFNCGAFQIP